jgi:hypothetical protein
VEDIMVLDKALLMALDTDFNTAVRVGDKSKAVAVFSALVGMAIVVSPSRSNQLYGMLSTAAASPVGKLTIDKNSVLALIAQHNS